MPVIINDFEVVMDPLSTRSGQGGSNRSPSGEGQAGEAAGGGAGSLRPEDIERIIRHYRERFERLLAD
jgi:hypothetical protein